MAFCEVAVSTVCMQSALGRSGLFDRVTRGYYLSELMSINLSGTRRDDLSEIKLPTVSYE
jgi:hypothetical protein